MSQTSGGSEPRARGGPGMYGRSYSGDFGRPMVPVQLFANDLHSCAIRRKCVE